MSKRAVRSASNAHRPGFATAAGAFGSVSLLHTDMLKCICAGYLSRQAGTPSQTFLLGKAPPLTRPRPRRSVSASPLGHLQKGTPAKRLHRISSPTKQRTPASARRGSRSPQKRRRSAVDAGVREGGVGAWFVSSDHLYSDLRWGFCCQSHLQSPRNLRN